MCSEWFEAGKGLSLFNLPPEETLIDTIREADIDTLAKEYFRDINKGLNPKVPYNYFPDDDDQKTPPFTWRSNAHLLVANWLNYYVYQQTPYDLNHLEG